MGNKVLVVYASKYGATTEIAEKIGEVLRQSDLQVDVLPVKSVKDVKAYQAIVLGTGVYIGQWLKEAVKFLKTNEGFLAKQLVWIFSSGPTGKGDPLELTKGWKFPAKLEPTIDSIKPIDVTLFHGAIDTKKLTFIEKYLIKMVKAEVGDFRDWNAISSWAKTIATEMKRR